MVFDVCIADNINTFRRYTMKINEFAQLDEFTVPGSKADRIKRGFMSYVKKQGGAPTTDAFMAYLDGKKMNSTGVAGMINKTTDKPSASTPKTITPKAGGTTATKKPQQPGAGVNQPVGKQTQPTAAQPKTAQPKKASTLNSYFQNFSKTMKQTADKGQKIALAKELVNIVADRGGQDSQSAVALLRRSGTLDNNFKQAAMNALKKGTRMESVFVEQFLQVLEENDISLKDIGLSMTLTEDRAYIVTLLERELTAKEIETLSKQAAKDNKSGNFGAFASGLSKGFKAGRNPLKTAGGAIADKFKKAASDNEGGNNKDKDSGENNTTADTRSGLNTLRTELGLENPAMAVKALEKLQAGKPISNKNELNAVKPLIGAMQTALQSQQGRARLKQLIKTLK